MKKYELVPTDSMYRIRALKDFSDVKAGDLGGFVEHESNLSQNGDCWVYDDAKVHGYARVYGDAKVSDYAVIYSHARVCGNARIFGNVSVFGDGEITGVMS
tara:strand:- start:1389 stop:1691 length:303 start_codon:yes stop_codon:yes gene_type:complete